MKDLWFRLSATPIISSLCNGALSGPLAIALWVAGSTSGGAELMPHGLSFHETGGPLLWQQDNLQLFASPQAPFTQNPLLSVIKLPASSPLTALLPSKRILLQTIDLDGVGVYVLGLDNLQQLDPIISPLHQHLGVCGVAQTFPSSRRLNASTSFIPPAYSSLVSLPSLETSLGYIDQSKMLLTINRLASLGSRHHTTGTLASDLVETLFTEASVGNSAVAISQISHSTSTQTSVVARIEGRTSTSQKVILGAHLDSVNSQDNLDAPGADDNASGIAILVELLRVISSQNLSFEKTLEFHAYAAEEVGLVGSGDIADSYINSQDSVVSMMQLDMSMWGANGNDPTLWLIKTSSSPDLIRSAINISKNYLKTPFQLAKLTTGTSDHKSWHDRGVPTLFAFESPTAYNPHIHTNQDTEDKFNNLELNLQITRLALLYLSHYGGLSSSITEYSQLSSQAFDGTDSDIGLAIDEDSHLAVGTTSEITYVELCSVNLKDQLDCSDERIELDEYLARGERRIFFSTTPLVLSIGQKWRVWAYNQDHTLLSKRDILLEARE